MIRTIGNIALSCAAGLLLAQASLAQNTNRFTLNIGGGFTEPVRASEGRLDMGFNINAGAGVNITPHVGIIGEFGFNHLGLTQEVLATAGVPGGNGRIYSVTANPIIRFNPRGRFDAYIIGGGGYYRRTVDFTAPSTATVTAFDPFYGFFPATIPTTTVLSSFTQNVGGWNAGAGISVRVKGDSNTKIFAEARYHQIYTDPVRTSILPVTFGLRW